MDNMNMEDTLTAGQEDGKTSQVLGRKLTHLFYDMENRQEYGKRGHRTWRVDRVCRKRGHRTRNTCFEATLKVERPSSTRAPTSH